MANTGTRAESRLLQYLPEIYRGKDNDFLNGVLAAFEKILLGRDDGLPFPSAMDDGTPLPQAGVHFPDKGLEESIADVAGCIDPYATPKEFLQWLAGWVALTLRADLTELEQRDFIARILPLYAIRGTPRYLTELLKNFSRFSVGDGCIADAFDEKPHFFTVTILWTKDPVPTILLRELAIARAVIEQAKPAHTDYELIPFFPSMQVGVRSTVGVDTLLGAAWGGE